LMKNCSLAYLIILLTLFRALSNTGSGVHLA
jgi:hypothetical protein